MRNLIAIIVFSLLLPNSSNAQLASIRGKAPYHIGKEVKAFLFDDLITYAQRELDTCVVNDSGNFYLNFNIPSIKYVLLKIGHASSPIYTAPGKTYFVRIPLPDSAGYVNEKANQSLNLSFLSTDTTELNSLVADYNHCFDDFWNENYQYFIKKRAFSKLDSFTKAMDDRYQKIHNPYFKTYREYSAASLKESISMSTKKLAREYVISQPVLYDNYEYMQFFNTFFKNYLYNFSSRNDSAYKLLRNHINPTALLELMKKDTVLKDAALRELVMLKGLYELCFMAGYDKENLLGYIRIVSQTTAIDEHRHIALNILNAISKLRIGTTAPNIILTTLYGDTIQLSEICRSKYVYLQFWENNCQSCLSEMEVMKRLYKTYGKQIEFVSIYTGKSIEDMRSMVLSDKELKWIFAFAGPEHRVIGDYEARGTPIYFLIDKQQRLLQSPAEKPTDNIERHFHKLTAAKRKQYKVGEW